MRYKPFILAPMEGSPLTTQCKIEAAPSKNVLSIIHIKNIFRKLLNSQLQKTIKSVLCNIIVGDLDSTVRRHLFFT